MLTRLQARTARRLFSTESLKVVNDVAKQQFTVTLDGENAVLGYELKGKELKLIHTEVPAVCEGKGVGKILAKHAFDHAQEKQLNVTCQCHFLAKYYLNNRDQYRNVNVKIDDNPHIDDNPKNNN